MHDALGLRVLEELREGGIADVRLAEGRITSTHGVLDGAGLRVLVTLALAGDHGLAQQAEGIGTHALGVAGGLLGHAVVEIELVAVRDEELAGRRFVAADADDALVQLAELADQGGEVTVAGHDDERGDVRAAVGDLHGVDGHLDVGAVLGTFARRGHLDELEPCVHQLATCVTVTAPVRVGALHDDAALLGQTAEDEVDVEVSPVTCARAGEVLDVDQHRECGLGFESGQNMPPEVLVYRPWAMDHAADAVRRPRAAREENPSSVSRR